MSNGILVFIEHRDGALNRTSLEAVAAAQSLAAQMDQPVTAVIAGADVSALAQEIAVYDLAKVIQAKNEKLAQYTPDGYTDAIESVVRQLDPQLVVFPHTYLVRDFAPKLAARFEKALISDCIRAQAAGTTLRFTRRIFLGKLDADVVSDGAAPVFATFQSGSYRPDQARKGSAPIEEMQVEIANIRMTPEAPFQEVKQAVDLSKADIIVAVGRGIKSKDNLALAEKLAQALGGDLAASRRNGYQSIAKLDRQDKP
jgi:electron transfer flavoprotein alpha subunit